jgi:hypothetical protein
MRNVSPGDAVVVEAWTPLRAGNREVTDDVLDGWPLIDDG